MVGLKGKGVTYIEDTEDRARGALGPLVTRGEPGGSAFGWIDLMDVLVRG